MDTFYLNKGMNAPRPSHPKIYTEEEVQLVNLLINKGKTMALEEENEIFNVRDQNKMVTLTWLDGSQHNAQINWLQQVEGDYFLAGLTYLREGKLLHGDEGDEWMLKRDEEVGFIPLFCTLHWSEKKEN